MKLKQQEACYWCRGTPTTSEHIPPKCFFNEPRPNNLITVPACETCNSEWSGIGSAFRDFVACSANGETFRQRLDKVFSPNNTGQASFKSLRDGVRHVNLKTPFRRYTKGVLSLPEEQGNAFLIRITKGLIYKYDPELWQKVDEFDFYAFPLTDLKSGEKMGIPNLAALLGKIKYETRGAGEFQFGSMTPPGSRISVWVYGFYQSALFIVFVRPKAL